PRRKSNLARPRVGITDCLEAVTDQTTSVPNIRGRQREQANRHQQPASHDEGGGSDKSPGGNGIPMRAFHTIASAEDDRHHEEGSDREAERERDSPPRSGHVWGGT